MTNRVDAAIGIGLVVVWMLAMGWVVFAQTAPPLGVSSATTTACTVTVTEPWTPAPPSDGWTFRPTWRVQGGTPQPFPTDSAAPWTSTRAGFAAGVTYNLAGTWTKGRTTVLIPVTAFTCPGVTPPPPPPPPPPAEVCGDGVDNDKDGQVDEGCPTVPPPTPPPPPPAGDIFGIVDPTILGTCSAAVHDGWVVPGGDGLRYRTWHPQVDPSGCVYANEHGDNPASLGGTEGSLINAVSPVMFGYLGKRMQHLPNEPNGHEEAHEGFKVFLASRGECNNEGRCSRQWQRSVTHFGTYRPGRFNQRFHSSQLIWIHEALRNPDGSPLVVLSQGMFDTGGIGVVCGARRDAPVKDVISLDARDANGVACKIDSRYEIWRMQFDVKKADGSLRYRAFATPAAFDSITVFNPANPTEEVFAWDPRVAAIKNFPGDDWSGNRGCDRESYAQPGDNHQIGPREVFTDVMGVETTASNPLAVRQLLPTTVSIGQLRASTPVNGETAASANHQFKIRRDYCQNKSRLGLKN
jgi:hypothetical protein